MSEKSEVGLLTSLVALVIFGILVALFSLPATYLLMLFLGNLGLEVGFFGALPGGILLSLLYPNKNKTG